MKAKIILLTNKKVYTITFEKMKVLSKSFITIDEYGNETEYLKKYFQIKEFITECKELY